MYYLVDKVDGGYMIGDTDDGKIEFVSRNDYATLKNSGVVIESDLDLVAYEYNNFGNKGFLINRLYKALEREASVEKFKEIYYKYGIFPLYANQYSNIKYKPDFSCARVFDYTQTRGFVVLSVPNRFDNRLTRLVHISSNGMYSCKDAKNIEFRTYPACSGSAAKRVHPVSGKMIEYIEDDEIYLCFYTEDKVELVPISKRAFCGVIPFEVRG